MATTAGQYNAAENAIVLNPLFSSRENAVTLLHEGIHKAIQNNTMVDWAAQIPEAIKNQLTVSQLEEFYCRLAESVLSLAKWPCRPLAGNYVDANGQVNYQAIVDHIKQMASYARTMTHNPETGRYTLSFNRTITESDAIEYTFPAPVP